jgi:4-aminobutyrate aminotransferase / (S)-3-amino-2-methylpropionate transaminase / 5-aminovalerate transaminase
VIVPPPELLPELGRMARRAGALLIADEIWTGLGRAGKMLCSASHELVPDLICLGKGLGGGLPISACIGSEEAMYAWRREREVVHTSTFAGAPLACAAALATLDAISRGRLCERSAEVGAHWLEALRRAAESLPEIAEVRGQGLMIGIDLGQRPEAASRLAGALLEHGFITSTGGGGREVLVLTPPLTIAEGLLDGFMTALSSSLRARAR